MNHIQDYYLNSVLRAPPSWPSACARCPRARLPHGEPPRSSSSLGSSLPPSPQWPSGPVRHGCQLSAPQRASYHLTDLRNSTWFKNSLSRCSSSNLSQDFVKERQPWGCRELSLKAFSQQAAKVSKSSIRPWHSRSLSQARSHENQQLLLISFDIFCLSSRRTVLPC